MNSSRITPYWLAQGQKAAKQGGKLAVYVAKRAANTMGTIVRETAQFATQKRIQHRQNIAAHYWGQMKKIHTHRNELTEAICNDFDQMINLPPDQKPDLIDYLYSRAIVDAIVGKFQLPKGMTLESESPQLIAALYASYNPRAIPEENRKENIFLNLFQSKRKWYSALARVTRAENTVSKRIHRAELGRNIIPRIVSAALQLKTPRIDRLIAKNRIQMNQAIESAQRRYMAQLIHMVEGHLDYPKIAQLLNESQEMADKDGLDRVTAFYKRLNQELKNPDIHQQAMNAFDHYTKQVERLTSYYEERKMALNHRGVSGLFARKKHGGVPKAAEALDKGRGNMEHQPPIQPNARAASEKGVSREVGA